MVRKTKIIMRKLIVSIFTVMVGLGAFAQEDPVIMTINGKEITKTEFLQIYLKNNNDPKYDKASLDEYMELFKKFKLKVTEAEAMGYDTIPRLVKELDGYRKQLALPYLVDSAKNEALVREAYDRTKTEVRASHILIKSDVKSSPKDTLNAYNHILALKKRIEGGEDFETVARSNGGSEDPSVSANGGDLGYFTAFQMVYPFEEQAYTTPVGSVSDIFKTRFGYHILKVTDTRPARGTIESAHIMVAVGKNVSEAEENAAKDKINEIYELLKSGENFEELVKKYSDDPSSNAKDGKLPLFGTGSKTRMVPVFEEAAFSLKNDGDFSEPVRTDFGYHIIKRISWKDIAAFDDMKKTLAGKVAKDERSKQTQNSFVEKKKKEYGFKKKSDKTVNWFSSMIDSTYFNGEFKADVVKSNKTIFTLDGKDFGQQDFAEYLEKNYRAIRRSVDPSNIVALQYAQWEKKTILAYEESMLPAKYPAYKALITEYHDGILLYEIMSDMVWNKAMRDSTGLKEFYENNASDYMWGKRIDADVYECYTKEAADQTFKLLQNDTSTVEGIVQIVNDKTELNVRHRDGKFDIEKTRFFTGVDLKKGINPIYENDGKFFVVEVKDILEPSPKEFDEAKGAVTSDYQTYLETKWMDELSKKHKVVVNKDALYSIGQ